MSRQGQTDLPKHPTGGYHSLPGGEAFSSGVVAAEGHAIVGAVFLEPPPLAEGLRRAVAWVRQAERPVAALCGLEPRVPRPLSRAEFVEFNREYVGRLEELGLLLEGRSPLARTNVAPSRGAPAAPALAGFSYTVPVDAKTRPTFIVAGVGELRGGAFMEAPVVRPGEVSVDAMREKATFVIGVLNRRLAELGTEWSASTAITVYTIRTLEPYVENLVLDPLGPGAARGIRWLHARPPIDELEFEVDVRGLLREEWIA